MTESNFSGAITVDMKVLDEEKSDWDGGRERSMTEGNPQPQVCPVKPVLRQPALALILPSLQLANAFSVSASNLHVGPHPQIMDKREIQHVGMSTPLTK